jgi:hypothetical protein
MVLGCGIDMHDGLSPLFFRNCSNPKIKGAVVFHNQGPQLFDYSIRLNHTWAFSGFPDVRTIMDVNGPYLNDLELGVNIIPTMQYSSSAFFTVCLLISSHVTFSPYSPQIFICLLHVLVVCFCFECHLGLL